jgi:hypothetical protein
MVVALVVGELGVQRPASTLPDPAKTLEHASPVPRPIVDVLHRACFDCHSSETRWPWYSWVPPTSWLVTHDVNSGRRQLNFAEWKAYNAFDRADLLDKICDRVTKKKMPLWPYRLLHPAARLTDDDAKAICAWTDQEATRLVQGGT